MLWSIAVACSPCATEIASGDSTLALAAASIGAAMLALAPIARSIGAAASRARSMLALRSSSDSTSLSGSAVAPSAASSSREIRDGFVTVPPGFGPLSGRYRCWVRMKLTVTVTGTSRSVRSRLSTRSNRADLVGEARPQLARQVVAHALEADELRSADVLGKSETAAHVDQRVVETMHDQRRHVDVAEELRPVRLRHRRGELPDIATAVERPLVAAARELTQVDLVERETLRPHQPERVEHRLLGTCTVGDGAAGEEMPDEVRTWVADEPRPGRRHDERQAADAVRVLAGDRLRNEPAHRRTDDMRRVD